MACPGSSLYWGCVQPPGTVACIGGVRLVAIAPLVGPTLARVALGWVGSRSRRVTYYWFPGRPVVALVGWSRWTGSSDLAVEYERRWDSSGQISLSLGVPHKL